MRHTTVIAGFVAGLLFSELPADDETRFWIHPLRFGLYIKSWIPAIHRITLA